jgi:hypothetical protein
MMHDSPKAAPLEMLFMPDVVAVFPDLSCFHLHSKAESMDFNDLLLIHPGPARVSHARALVREPPPAHAAASRHMQLGV